MSGRFRLDPKAPAPQRAVPPPPPAPVARVEAPPLPPPPAPTSPSASAPASDAKRKRAIVLVAVIVGLLLVGGGVAIYVATATGYPDAYLLEEREYPSGLSKARLSSQDMDDLGLRSNPGRISDDKLEEYADSDDDPPEEGHALILQQSSGARIVVTAVRYADEDSAIDFAKQARALCSFLGGSVLRDGDILVGVINEGGASSTQVRAVANALKAKNDDLTTVC